mmetsp:Transcript_75543/g.147953  ORF Transcript_75543/g.147953 Transcript_75543/m.147953 type:complete len:200 (+) Transcript_75543:410-1009(+)
MLMKMEPGCTSSSTSIVSSLLLMLLQLVGALLLLLLHACAPKLPVVLACMPKDKSWFHFTAHLHEIKVVPGSTLSPSRSRHSFKVEFCCACVDKGQNGRVHRPFPTAMNLGFPVAVAASCGGTARVPSGLQGPSSRLGLCSCGCSSDGSEAKGTGRVHGSSLTGAARLLFSSKHRNEEEAVSGNGDKRNSTRTSRKCAP